MDTYYTIGARWQGAFECDGAEDWDEACKMLKDAYAEWAEEEDRMPENEPVITEFHGDEAVDVYGISDI